MMSNAKIGVALVGGYVLGRTKKAKLAIGLGMYLAGKRLPLDPKQLGELVANSPVLGPLNDQVRSELVDATKSAVSTALTQRMSALTERKNSSGTSMPGRSTPSRVSATGWAKASPDSASPATVRVDSSAASPRAARRSAQAAHRRRPPSPPVPRTSRTPSRTRSRACSARAARAGAARPGA
ncbi:hypothetical protein SAMN05428943_6406 [Streptomyces sp. 2314.4]|nr:hypothetical protein SAMN05428943_6406 [Streptomyces sp. 2314.4]